MANGNGSVQGHEGGVGGAMVTPQPSTAMVKAEPAALRAPSWVPRNFAQVMRLSEIVVTSRLAPRAVTTKEAAFVIIMTGLELGLSAMQALRHISVIEGKPALSAALIVARVKRAPECRYFRVVKMTAEECTCETQRSDEPEPTRLTWTLDDAKRANLLGKDNWKHYPRAMLRNRCQAELARAVYPDAVDGLYDPDELGAITSEDGEVIEVRVVPPPAPPSQPKAAAAAPAPAPAPVVDLAALARQFEERIGAIVRDRKTKADLKAIGIEIARSPLARGQRDALAEIYDLALADIDARDKAGREPGEEG